MPCQNTMPSENDHNGSNDMANPRSVEKPSAEDGSPERSSPDLRSRSSSPTESPPRSGTQTPAACRPLLRRAQNIHTWPNFRQSEFSHLDSLRQQNLPEAAALPSVPLDRSPSYDALSHLKNVQEEYEDDAFIPKPTKHGPISLMPLWQRPTPLLRRVSNEVRDREQSLRREIETLRGQLRDQEEQHEENRKKQESMMVEFAMNRMLEMQQTQMAVQQKLLEKFGAMDLQGQGVPESFSRRSNEESEGGLPAWEREWMKHGTN